MGRPHASVHHHLQTRLTSSLGSRLVNDPHLHPDYFSADGDGVLDDRGDCFGFSKDLRNIHGFRNVSQTWVGLLPQDLFRFRVDGDDPIPLLLQVQRNAVAFPIRIRGKPDYRNGLGFGENGFELV